MKLAFETKGMFVIADEERVKLHAEAGDTKIYGDVTWDEITRAYTRTRSHIPRKVREALEVQGEVV